MCSCPLRCLCEACWYPCQCAYGRYQHASTKARTFFAYTAGESAKFIQTPITPRHQRCSPLAWLHQGIRHSPSLSLYRRGGGVGCGPHQALTVPISYLLACLFKRFRHGCRKRRCGSPNQGRKLGTVCKKGVFPRINIPAGNRFGELFRQAKAR